MDTKRQTAEQRAQRRRLEAPEAVDALVDGCLEEGQVVQLGGDECLGHAGEALRGELRQARLKVTRNLKEDVVAAGALLARHGPKDGRHLPGLVLLQLAGCHLEQGRQQLVPNRRVELRIGPDDVGDVLRRQLPTAADDDLRKAVEESVVREAHSRVGPDGVGDLLRLEGPEDFLLHGHLAQGPEERRLLATDPREGPRCVGDALGGLGVHVDDHLLGDVREERVVVDLERAVRPDDSREAHGAELSTAALEKVRGQNLEEGDVTQGELREGPQQVRELEGFHFRKAPLCCGGYPVEDGLLAHAKGGARPTDDAQAPHLAGLVFWASYLDPGAVGVHRGGEIVHEGLAELPNRDVRHDLLAHLLAARQREPCGSVQRRREVDEVHGSEILLDYLQQPHDLA
mmetsp:Transcript_28932/g.92891  ORF Transcript_28932/g.92891 Transcript_28932/m.92891 type:complete len:401 (+) Transcript_28932:933-2135(+)